MEIGEKYAQGEKICQIISKARHVDTGEWLLVYQELYGNFEVYGQEVEKFLSQWKYVEKENGLQGCRYAEKDIVEFREDKKSKSVQQIELKRNTMQDLLMDFYDAKTYEKKYHILEKMERDITDVMIDNMAVVLDVVIPEGRISDRYEALKSCVRTCQKYEVNRLY